jgi:hypothetical protein
MLVYLPIIFVATVVSTIEGILILKNLEIIPNYSSSFRSLFVVAQILIVYLLGVIAALLIVFRLSKKGTSAELRKIVVQRHLIYIVVFLFYTLLIINNMNEWFFHIIKDGINQNRLFQIFGFVLFLSRISEPYIFNNIVRDLCNLLVCFKQKKQS